MTAAATALNVKTMEEKILWENEVISMKEEILTSRSKNSIQILWEVFEYCQGEYDVLGNNEKLFDIYTLLKELTNDVPESNIELCKRSKKLLKVWQDEKKKEEIRKKDVQLYYALLRYVDYIKSLKFRFGYN